MKIIILGAGQVGGAACDRVSILVGDYIERRPDRQQDLAIAVAE